MVKRNLLLGLLLALPLATMAQSEDQLIQRYTELAGSKENATSLVTGLRDGKEVTLKQGASTITFTPKTEKMGYGNIDNALALAEASIGNDPTPTELKSVLMSGTVDGVKYEGILNMRASGMGWGVIARELGFKLGEVKRSDNANPKGSSVEPVAKVERASRPEKPERSGKGR